MAKFSKINTKVNKLVNLIQEGLEQDELTISDMETIEMKLSAMTNAAASVIRDMQEDTEDTETDTDSEPTSLLQSIIDMLEASDDEEDTTDTEPHPVNRYIRDTDTEAFIATVDTMQRIQDRPLSETEIIRYRAAAEQLDQMLGLNR